MGRGHKSTKVPGVKIRPPPQKRPDPTTATSSKGKEKLVNHGESETEGEEENAEDAFGAAPRLGEREMKPFEGFLLTMTGIGEEKPRLVEKAKGLGAKFSSDLEASTTHLIAERVGSEKYKFAVEYGIHVMLPDWVSDTHTKWTAADELDLQELFQEYRMPVFHRLKMMLVGFEPAAEKEMKALLRVNGAEIVKTPEHSSHLISGPSVDPSHPPPQVLAALNCQAADDSKRKARVQIVRVEWVHDCIKIGGAIKENMYRWNQELTERMKLKSVETPSQVLTEGTMVMASSSTQANLNPKVQTNVEAHEPKANLKRKHPTIDLINHLQLPKETEIARLKTKAGGKKGKLGGVDGLLDWAEKKVLDDRDSTGMELDDLPAVEAMANATTKDAGSIKSSVTVRSGDTQAPISTIQKLRSREPRGSSSGTAPGSSRQRSDTPLSAFETTPDPVEMRFGGERTECFKGLKFAYRGFGHRDKAIMETAVIENGGTIVKEGGKVKYDWLVLPFSTSEDLGTYPEDKAVTDLWMERCLYENRVVSPDEWYFGRPIRCQVPLPNVDKLVLSRTGMDTCDGLLLNRVLDRLGIKTNATVARKRTTHMLCTDDIRDTDRVKKAESWGIEVVPFSWLTDLMRANPVGEVPKTEDDKSAWQTKSDNEMVEITNSLAIAEPSAFPASPSWARPPSQHGNCDVPRPLEGLVIAVTKKVEHRATLSQIANELGATFATTFSDSITHLIHVSDKPNDTLKDFKLAKFAKKAIVHPRWLEDCQKTCSRLDERNYPHTLDTRKALQLVSIQQASENSPALHRKSASFSRPADGLRESNGAVMEEELANTEHTLAPSRGNLDGIFEAGEPDEDDVDLVLPPPIQLPAFNDSQPRSPFKPQQRSQEVAGLPPTPSRHDAPMQLDHPSPSRSIGPQPGAGLSPTKVGIEQDDDMGGAGFDMGFQNDANLYTDDGYHGSPKLPTPARQTNAVRKEPPSEPSSDGPLILPSEVRAMAEAPTMPSARSRGAVGLNAETANRLLAILQMGGGRVEAEEEEIEQPARKRPRRTSRLKDPSIKSMSDLNPSAPKRPSFTTRSSEGSINNTSAEFGRPSEAYGSALDPLGIHPYLPHQTQIHDGQSQEQSMMVTYLDPAAVREKDRIFKAVLKAREKARLEEEKSTKGSQVGDECVADSGGGTVGAAGRPDEDGMEGTTRETGMSVGGRRASLRRSKAF